MHNGSTTDAALPDPSRVIRTSVKLDARIHAAGKVLAEQDNRDFQSWVAAQIKERWKAAFGDRPMPENTTEPAAAA